MNSSPTAPSSRRAHPQSEQIDDAAPQVYDHAKQVAAYGCSKMKRLNAQLAILSTSLSTPVTAASKLRHGNVSSASGSTRLLVRALTTARATSVSCQVMVHADSTYFSHAFISTARRGGRDSPRLRSFPMTDPLSAVHSLRSIPG